MIFKPYAYQKYCITRLITDTALGLFLDMGLGKTTITLTALNDLKYNRFAVHKTLIVAPKKVAESTWGRETKKWDHLQHLRVKLVLGSAQKRIKALNSPADIWVINRENLVWLVEYYRNCWPFDFVVIDESSSFKNHKAKRFKALTWVRKGIKRIVLLTGTPSPNGLLDLWAQIYLLDSGERLGKYITHYRERYFEADARSREQVFSYAPKMSADESIHQKISDICVSMKADDYLDLPDCISVETVVLLDDKAKKDYQQLEKKMLLELVGETIDIGSAAALSNKLLQLCNGAVYNEEKEMREVHSCKIEAFLELIEGLNGKPVLVFYNFQHDLFRIKKALQNSGLKVRELKTPADEDAWNNKQLNVLLAHPASAAYGLNLQDGGNHVIWFGLNWSLELYQQANKRLHRQGQKEKVIIHHLIVDGGLDEDVMRALGEKADTQDRLLDALKVRIEKAKDGL